MDILYSVPAVQIFGAGSVPAMRPPPLPPPEPSPAAWLPVWRRPRGDRRPGPDTWNASCPVEALPLYCVFEKLCTDPQVEWKGPLVRESEHANTKLTCSDLNLYSEIKHRVVSSLRRRENKLKSKFDSFEVKSCKFLVVGFEQQSLFA